MSVDLSHWLKVDITLKHKTDLSTTTVSLTNKAELSDILSDHWPILLSIGRLGASSDREIVLPEAGSILILNSIGSFGVDRKFSDLLERYEIIDQALSVNYAVTEANVLNPVTFTNVFTGKVLDYDCDVDKQIPTVEIRFDTRLFERRVLNKIINTTDHASAPLESINKTLPLVFGEDIQVRPVSITAAGATNPQYAYATTYSTEHPVGGIQKYYVRDLSDNYTRVLSTSLVSAPALSQAGGSSGAYDIGSLQEGTLRDSESIAFNLESIDFSASPHVITHVEIECVGYNDAGESLTSGVLICEIYTKNAIDGSPQFSIGYGQINSSDFNTEIKGSSDFSVIFTLDTPVVMHNASGYYLVLTQTDLFDSSGTRQNTSFKFRITPNISHEDWLKIPGSNTFFKTGQQDLECGFYALEMVDYPAGTHTGSDGISDAYYQLNQKTAVSGYQNPDISVLDWIVEIDGLKDDSSGTITGSSSSLIKTPHHAIKLLSQVYSTSWGINTNWDFNAYSSTHNSNNNINGALEGLYRLEDAIQEICQNSASKVVLRKNGKLAIYTYGDYLDSVATFTQENSKIIRYGSLDSTYVVNNTKIGYDRQLIYFNPINAISQNLPTDYTQIDITDKDTVGYSGIIGNSESLYDKRYNIINLYNLVSTSSQATIIKNYVLNNFIRPPIYVNLEVPFEYYADLELQNVIKIKHPSLPTYFGGSPNTKLPHYDGEEIDVHNGNILTRAKLYRAQIEGLRISFNQDAVPTLLLTCRLLLNENDPT